MKSNQIIISRDVVEAVGAHPATVLAELAGLISYNRRADIGRYGHDYRQCPHCVGGSWWTYGSRQEMAEMLGWLSENQFYTATKKLEAAGYLQIKCYNRASYDKTRWYGLTEAGKAACGWTTKEEKKKRKEAEKIPKKKKEEKKQKQINAGKRMQDLGMIDNRDKILYASIWHDALADHLIDQATYDAGILLIQQYQDNNYIFY